MELLQLRYFCTVARLENISRAAQHHMVPQSAMSKTISKLERELDTPLFTRVKNKLALTEEGQILYQGVRQSLFDLDSAIQTLQDRKESDELRGDIKCLFLEHRYNLVDCVVAFKQLHPQVRFFISYSDKLENMTDYDLCVVSSLPDSHSFTADTLTHESLKIAVSANHPLASRTSVTIADLRDEGFLMISPESSLLKTLRHHCERAGFQPTVTAYVDDLRCMEKYVSSNFGITVVPEISWKQLPFHGSVLLPVEEPGFGRATSLLRSNLKPLSKAAAAFHRFLLDHYEEMVCSTAS